MAPATPSMPLGMRFKLWARAMVWAVPGALVVSAEVKDMYYRATWQVVPVPPGKYETGDVIAIANRWYTLPGWGQVARCLFTKVLLRSTWDDIGVVIMREGKPYLLIADYDCVVDRPLEDFVEERKPRGVALRKLIVEPGFIKPTTEVAELFAQEVKKLPASPWYLASASRRTTAEEKYYTYLTNFNALKAEYRQSCRALIGAPGAVAASRSTARKSKLAMDAMEQRLKEMEVMREHLAAQVEREVVDVEYKLFNGSLVASFLATFDLLNRDMPCISRYVPQDFAHPMPLKGSTLAAPLIVFKN